MPLAGIIRTHKEEILEEWEAIVRSLSSARKLPEPALRDHMPSLLDWIVTRLEHEQIEDVGVAHEMTLEHALGRINAGYDLSELLSEYMVMRDCIHGAWEQSGLTDVTAKEVRRMNQALDDTVTFTAVFYFRSNQLQPPVEPELAAV